jgi:hypothetical protein
MTSENDKAARRATRFVLFCIAVYGLSAAAWILIQRYQGRSYLSAALDARLLISALSICALIAWVGYLVRKLRVGGKPPSN